MAMFLSLVVTIGAVGFSPADVAGAKRAVFEDGRYQRELPLAEVPSKVREPKGGHHRASRSVRSRPRSSVAPAGGSTISSAVGIGLLVGVAILVFFWLALRFRNVGWNRRTRVQEQVPEKADDPEASAPTSELLETLVAAGRFGDAIRVLLKQAVLHVQSLTDVAVGPSTTGRELLRRVHLIPAGAAALEALVDAVELAHFGGREVDHAGYTACHAHLNALMGSRMEEILH